MIERKRSVKDIFLIMILCVLTVIFLIPMFLVLMNSFKSRLFVSTQPFSFPNAQTFVGFENYINGLTTSGFFMAFLRSVWITVVSVVIIVIFTSMTAWYIIRVNSKFTKSLYYLFVFSMIVPFQMVMYTMTFVVNTIAFNNVFGIILVYLGFGAGLAVFMFTGFVKSIPVEVEEAATIDGCTPLQTFFMVVFPMLKSITITVAILNVMWIWNDYLLPYLVLDIKKYKTIPIAVQYLKGGYGSVDMGAMMAMLVLAIIPIIIFYMTCQKYIIEGVIAGAVKG